MGKKPAHAFLGPQPHAVQGLCRWGLVRPRGWGEVGHTPWPSSKLESSCCKWKLQPPLPCLPHWLTVSTRWQCRAEPGFPSKEQAPTSHLHSAQAVEPGRKCSSGQQGGTSTTESTAAGLPPQVRGLGSGQLRRGGGRHRESLRPGPATSRPNPAVWEGRRKTRGSLAYSVSVRRWYRHTHDWRLASLSNPATCVPSSDGPQREPDGVNGGPVGERQLTVGRNPPVRGSYRPSQRARAHLRLRLHKSQRFGLFGQQRALCSLLSAPPDAAQPRLTKACAHRSTHTLTPHVYTTLEWYPEDWVFSARPAHSACVQSHITRSGSLAPRVLSEAPVRHTQAHTWSVTPLTLCST